MKILIINHRYFISGGPERYLFNLNDLLEEKGHEVIPFSISYSANLQSDYEEYFVPPIAKADEVNFSQHTWDFQTIVKTIQRTFYSKEVYVSLTKLINDTKPDCAIVLHYLKKLSPAVVQALVDKNIPFVVRLSDFGMLCPNELFLRGDQICELCSRGNFLYSVFYKCVKNSYVVSLVNYAAIQYRNWKNYINKINHFIVPSKFLYDRLIAAGFSNNNLFHLPTFVKINDNKISKRKNQIIYFGRIERSKGIHILVKAINILKYSKTINFQCIIAGYGNKEYQDQIIEYIKNNKLENISFIEFQDIESLETLIKESLFSVSPSIWYENMPNSVLESLTLGTPVIVPNHGSFPEIIINGKNGLLFEPSNEADLALKIEILLNDHIMCNEMSNYAKVWIKQNHSADIHYDKLNKILNTITKNKY